MSPLQYYINCQHTQITNTRLSPAILNNVIKEGSSERLDHPNTFRLFLKHLQFLFRWIGACQLSKIKGDVSVVKTTKALKHTNPLHSPSTSTFSSILFNLLSVTFSNAYSRLHSHSAESQFRNQQKAQAEASGAEEEADLPVSWLCHISHKYWMHLSARQHAGDQVLQHSLSAPVCCQCNLTAVIYNSLAYSGAAPASCSISLPPTLSLGRLTSPQPSL